MEEPLAVRVVAGLLLVAAARTAGLPRQPPGTAWMDPRTGPETLVPDLDHDGVDRLSLLPGVGRGRARRIVAGRPFLPPGGLRPERLPLIPGVGETTAAEVADWYRDRCRRAPPVECADEGVGGGPHRGRGGGGARPARGPRGP